MAGLNKEIAKIRRWCAIQERCLVDVKIHALALGLNEKDTDKAIETLIDEGFIDEERYAKIYAGSKFRNKNWGRARIIGELKARQLPDDVIKVGLSEIDEEEYRERVIEMVKHKIAVTDRTNVTLFKHRLAKPAIAKGYEPDLVHEIINELIKEKK
ncbi:MAG: regulatory protein RecX [Chloroflexota bacterium]|jgi:regulatory protein|nr:regulatory protein RecX [Lentimicrobium sp.]